MAGRVLARVTRLEMPINREITIPVVVVVHREVAVHAALQFRRA